MLSGVNLSQNFTSRFDLKDCLVIVADVTITTVVMVMAMVMIMIMIMIM